PAGAAEAIWPDAAPDQDAPAGVWALRRPEPTGARTRETGDLPVPWVRPQLWADQDGKVHGASADSGGPPAGQAQRGESRAAAPQARSSPRGGPLAGIGSTGPLPVLRHSGQFQGHCTVSRRSEPTLAPSVFQR